MSLSNQLNNQVNAARAGSFLDRLKSRMTGLNNPYGLKEVPRERSHRVIHTNRFDNQEWKVQREQEIMDDLVTDLSLGDQHSGGERPEFQESPELVEGVFQTFFKVSPELLPARAIARELRPVRKIVEEMMDNPRLADLQEYTAGDGVMSAMAVDSMAETLREILTRIPPPPQPPGLQPQPQDPKGPKGPEGEGEGPIVRVSPGEGGDEAEGFAPPPPEEQDADENEDEHEDLTEDADTGDFDPDADIDQEEADWENQYDELMKDLDLDRLANRALEQAYKDVSEVDDLRKGIGVDDGVWATMDPSERLALVKQLQTPEMKALSEIIGRMSRFSLGVKSTRVNDVPHEPYDVERGQDIPHLLKSEFALLSNPVARYEFFRKYADKELLQYKRRGTEEVGKGPIVMAIDKSGSMNGQPFRWAMAVAEALRRFAKDDDRDMYVIFFGSNNDRTRFEFPQGTAPFEKVMSFLGTIANGGTEFDGVLTECLKRASESFDDEAKGKADIVFMTDGQSHLSDKWISDFNAERSRVGVRVYSVFIGGSYDMRYQEGPLGLLEKISDVTIPVRDLTPESVETLFTKI